MTARCRPRTGTGLDLVGAGLFDPFGERVPGRGAAGVDRLAVLAVLRRFEEQVPGDFDDLAVDGDGAGVLVDLGDAEGGQLAPAQPAAGGGVGHQLVTVPVHPAG